jgi:HD-GYP domain-containing protein (c-di-GMP phosphodiesterase class II)/pSer/pThr/pTyr-binding forkhead associated (FHA) protein
MRKLANGLMPGRGKAAASRRSGVKRSIRLRGMNGAFKGRTWESCDLLRIGRLDGLEVILDDPSVSRQHAEIHPTEDGWKVRDLTSTNGTRLNGVRLGNGTWPLRPRDLLQFGEIAVVVENLVNLETPPAPNKPVLSDNLLVTATARGDLHESLAELAQDCPRGMPAREPLLALLRASHSLVHIEKEEDLLSAILQEAVTVLDAQRGAVVLTEGPEGTLVLRALMTGRNEPRAVIAGRGEVASRFPYSQSLAQRCVSRGESILCQRAEEDPELAAAKSIAEGSMASVLCVLLRTPRRPLGVLHLDRSPWQKPFTMADLHLADALAANVSAGIECAQLFRKQHDLFLNTITILAQAVELRDQYTGGHTQRVSAYSILLAEQLNMSESDVELIRIGTPLHDIGKIGIDDAILRKPDRLTPEEFEQMKLHTVKGDEIIQTIPDLAPIRPIIRSHHERWDGKGYPDGLGGEAISPLARVVALADAFDAMTSDRSYRKGMPPAEAFAEIKKMTGIQFDPVFAAAFLSLQNEISQALKAGKTTLPSPQTARKKQSTEIRAVSAPKK